MFTQSSTETQDHIITGELLDWQAPECDCLTETQFMTAQQACAQAWKAIQGYMPGNLQSVFTELTEGRMTGLLANAILDACACQHRDLDKRLSVDQLCDAALTRMGLQIIRDEFGVCITGERIALPGGKT